MLDASAGWCLCLAQGSPSFRESFVILALKYVPFLKFKKLNSVHSKCCHAWNGERGTIGLEKLEVLQNLAIVREKSWYRSAKE